MTDSTHVTHGTKALKQTPTSAMGFFVSDNPADSSLREQLEAALVESVYWDRDVPQRVADAIWPLVSAGLEAARADARAQAFTEAAAAVQAERMPDPPTEEMRSRVDYWRGYDAAIFDAGEAVRGLGEETENA